jgi:hypothetical protein
MLRMNSELTAMAEENRRFYGPEYISGTLIALAESMGHIQYIQPGYPSHSATFTASLKFSG